MEVVPSRRMSGAAYRTSNLAWHHSPRPKTRSVVGVIARGSGNFGRAHCLLPRQILFPIVERISIIVKMSDIKRPGIKEGAPRAAEEFTFWENVAATRWGTYVSGIEQRAIRQAQSLNGNPGRALEIGCEGGRWSKMLSDLGWQMVCVDINREALRVCQQRLPQARCILARPEDNSIPCEPGSMDLLLCIEVAPVIESKWFLPEAGRVLRSEGIFVGVVLNRTSARAFTHKIKNKIGGKGFEFYGASYLDWRKNLCRAGFRLVHEEGFCWAPFGRESNSLLVPLFTRLERLLGLRRLPAFSPWVTVIARKNSPR